MTNQPGQPDHQSDLHGNAPDTCAVALLLIDVINAMDYVGGEQLLRQAVPMAKRLAQFKARCKRQHMPVLYVNDNFGQWQTDFPRLVAHCLEDDMPGKPIVQLLHPEEDDYAVLKPKHSGFYATPLELLLQHLQVTTLILTGLTGDYCVLLTASDAFLRGFRLAIPADCVVSIEAADNEQALSYMQRVFAADITPSDQLDIPALLASS